MFKTIVLGFLSGYLGGQFGIGGGLLTTPTIRLLLGGTPLIALGTPLPVMIPSAVTSSIIYYHNNLIDVKLARLLAISGIVGVSLGALSTMFISGHLIMLLTALVIFVLGVKFVWPWLAGLTRIKKDGRDNHQGRMAQSIRSRTGPGRQGLSLGLTLLIGFGCGFFSGLLGLGGGFLLIPALLIIFQKGIKQAFGTSLAVITAYVIPGTIIHSLLGHVNWLLAFFLALGVIPGAYLGAKVAMRLREQILQFAFGLFLIFIAAYFAYFEVLSILSV